jgi:hypothetical protein
MDIIGKIKLRVEKLKAQAAATINSYVSEVNDFTVNLQSLCGSGNELQSAVDMQISVFAYQFPSTLIPLPPPQAPLCVAYL